MFLNFVFHTLKSALSVTIRVLAKLLISLSLWVPLVYSVVFIVIVGISGGSLSQLKNWYLFGLALSFVGSFAVSAYLYEKQVNLKKQAKLKANLSKVNQKQQAVGLVKKNQASSTEFNQQQTGNEASNYTDLNSNASNLSVDGAQQFNHNFTNQQGAQSSQSSQFSQDSVDESHKPYQSYTSGFESGYDAGFKKAQAYSSEIAKKHGFSSYNSVNDDNYSGYSQPKQNGFDSEYGDGFGSGVNNEEGYKNQFYGYNMGGFDENGSKDNFKSEYPNDFLHKGSDYRQNDNLNQNSSVNNVKSGVFNFINPISGFASHQIEPMIFATRQDPSILIYEYPDRLEYYKKTKSGMILTDTKYKNRPSH